MVKFLRFIQTVHREMKWRNWIKVTLFAQVANWSLAYVIWGFLFRYTVLDDLWMPFQLVLAFALGLVQYYLLVALGVWIWGDREAFSKARAAQAIKEENKGGDRR